MKENSNQTEHCEHKHFHGCGHGHNQSHGGNAVYGLGLIGALIFFVGQATSFWMGVLGILKAIVWPAYLVFEVLNYFIK